MIESIQYSTNDKLLAHGYNLCYHKGYWILQNRGYSSILGKIMFNHDSIRSIHVYCRMTGRKMEEIFPSVDVFLEMKKE